LFLGGSAARNAASKGGKKMRAVRYSGRIGIIGSMSLFLLICFFSLSNSWAKDIYPAQDINFVCYAQPGGIFDVMARGMTPFLTKWLREVSPGAKGGAINVKNMTGGAGQQACNHVFREAKPDGYTIGDFNRGNLYRFQVSDEKLPFDVMKFSYLFSITNVNRIMISSKKSNIRTWEEMIAFSKKEPLKWAVSAVGGSEHIEAIYVKETLGINAKFTKWGAQSAVVSAIMRGDAHVTLINNVPVEPLIKAKEVNHLLSFTEKRLDPQVPTIGEKGFPQVEKNVGGKGGNVIIAPPNLDPEARRIIIAAGRKMLVDPAFLAFADKIQADIDPLFDKDVWGALNENLNFYKMMAPTLKKYLE
jgi:tripartite-type tricarboxylate transporter receptor subunit TctC